ncbi:MAG: UDP-2,3-diacylglucosamine diphosphatase [Bacteroidetes bacterium]|nr:UDP-2,3-diacylglucosamine diphosphatase [Bacteroidota bacterium]
MIYFASDFHLGIPNHANSLVREKLILKWLCEIEGNVTHLFLVGDLFDYWFEYKSVVPRGYTRLLGKLAELTDKGVVLYIFSGNHDVWMFDYFQKELNAIVCHEPIELTFDNKQFYIAHGDGLGPFDHGYKLIKKIFRNKTCQWLYRQLHPDLGYKMATFFSKSSRNKNYENDKKFLGEEKEWLVIHSKEILMTKKINYFIYGHRHLPMEIKLNEDSVCINLGDWISHFTYAVFDGKQLHLRKFKHN